VGNSEFTPLDVGDILYDTVTGDLAVLIARRKQWTYKFSRFPYSDGDEPHTIWVWDMHWIPPDFNTYTENSLLNMLDVGRLILYKCDSSDSG
tara:strand:- start:1521 stop:1796 length:276 start_codon:yes stop_codon:yes gene_type:complete